MNAQKKNQEGEKGVTGQQQSDYHAYLLRLWREGAQKPWRAELVSPHTGAKQHFADSNQLLTFLTELIASDGSATEHREAAQSANLTGAWSHSTPRAIDRQFDFHDKEQDNDPVY